LRPQKPEANVTVPEPTHPLVRSALPTGNGAFIVHEELSRTVPGYELAGCDPYLASIPGLPSRHLRRWLSGAPVAHLSPNTGHIPLSGDIARVLTFHSFDIDPGDMEQASLTQRFYYRHVLRRATVAACRSATRMIAVSRYVADRIRRNRLPGAEKVEVIYNGIDTARFRPAERQEQDRPFRILFVGNPTRRKGFQWLSQLASELPPGVEIAFTAGLRNQVTLESHSSLIPLGTIPYAEMHTAYQQADMLLFPAYREGFGLCIAEAMACGLPVVSSNCSAIPELLSNGRGGFLVAPGDLPGMIAAVTRLAGDRPLREAMGAWNREQATTRFDRDRMASDYQAVFSSCV
jgi:glycosyltransferase involved in cell wall biosynthesis